MKFTKLLFAFGILGIILTGSSFAQEAVKKDASGASPEKITVSRDDAIALARNFLKLERMTVLAQNIQLESQEQAAFWQEYGRYQERLEPLRDRMAKLIVAYSEKFDSMSDDDAKGLLEEMLSIQEEESKVRRESLPKFSAIMPMKKVARFYQIENKMNAEVRYAMSLEIPLLQAEDK